MPLLTTRVRRRLLIAFASLFGAYVASYLVLTVQGRYEPARWGLGGVVVAVRGFTHGVLPFRGSLELGGLGGAGLLALVAVR